MIYITGDCHGDYRKLSSDVFPEQKEMTKEDFLIVCGDFGIWNDSKDERYWLKWLSEKSFTVLFVDGNHENFDRLYSDEFPVVDFHGGKAHQIRENIFHLMRGYVFEIDDKMIFAFGGARSHDISDGIINPNDFSTPKEMKAYCKNLESQGKYMFRIKHESWWEQEMPSSEEMKFGMETLTNNDFKVDFVVTHCGPQEVISYFSTGLYKPDYITQYFNEIASKLTFNRWFFGHYHDDKDIFSNYIMLYDQIIRIA